MKKVEEMTFTLDDEPIHPGLNLNEREAAIKAALDSLPDGTMKSVMWLANTLGIKFAAADRTIRVPYLAEYHSLRARRTIVANPRTIKAWNEKNGKA